MEENDYKFLLRLPKRLHDKTKKECKNLHISMAQFTRWCYKLLIEDNSDEEIQKQKIAAFDRLRFHKLLQKEVLYQNARQLRMIGRNLNQITKRINIITNVSITQPVVNEFLDLKKELFDLKTKINKEIDILNKEREEIK